MPTVSFPPWGTPPLNFTIRQEPNGQVSIDGAWDPAWQFWLNSVYNVLETAQDAGNSSSSADSLPGGRRDYGSEIQALRNLIDNPPAPRDYAKAIEELRTIVEFAEMVPGPIGSPGPAGPAGSAGGGGYLDFFITLKSGENLIHSTGTVNGIVYLGLVINSGFTGPAKFIRMDPANPSAYQVLTFPADGNHEGLLDWIYVASKGKIYGLFCNSASLFVSEIDPTTLAYTDVIADTTSGYYAFEGSLSCDGTYIYVACAGNSPSVLVKYKLSDFSFVAALTLSFGGKDLLVSHNCRWDGFSLFISSGHTDLVTNLAFVRVDPATFTVVDGASLPAASPNSVLTDDSAFTANYVWYGSEDTGNVIQVQKSNLSVQSVVTTGLSTANFGIEYDGSYIWSCYDSSPGKLVRIDPVSLAMVVYQFGAGQEYPNEIFTLGNGLCFSFWQSPAKVSSASNMYAPLRV